MNPRVRLTPREQLALREAFQAVLPSDASAYLHGSRRDRNARGDDIDLLAHVPGLKDTEELPLVARLATEVEKAIGERKVDILLTGTLDDAAQPFVALALRKAGRLYP